MHKNLPNFGEASTILYHAGQPSKTGFHLLAKMGVNIVVDLRGNRDDESKIVTHLGMQYVAIPWQCSFPKDRIFAEFLTLLRRNPGKKIFVHCRLGDDRTAMMIASYRMAEEGWSAQRAENEMEKFGFSFAHRRFAPACLPMKRISPITLRPVPRSGTCVRTLDLYQPIVNGKQPDAGCKPGKSSFETPS